MMINQNLIFKCHDKIVITFDGDQWEDRTIDHETCESLGWPQQGDQVRQGDFIYYRYDTTICKVNLKSLFIEDIDKIKD